MIAKIEKKFYLRFTHELCMESIAWTLKPLILTVNVKISMFSLYLGGTQIRTGGKGFAILCLTTWPYRHFYFTIYLFQLK
jgi:hypothetical protein